MGGGPQNGHQAVDITSTYTGKKCGFINFEELNPTNKKLLGVNKVDYRPHNWL